jgi:hypothetical protein
MLFEFAEFQDSIYEDIVRKFEAGESTWERCPTTRMDIAFQSIFFSACEYCYIIPLSKISKPKYQDNNDRNN